MLDLLDRLKTALADRYRIDRELGAGGMATVFLAQDLRHERQVAVKVLRPELAAVLGAVRFVQEIKTTANLQHPHIVPLFDSGSAGGLLFYVMPLVEGETLRARLDRETQLSIEDAVAVTREVADGLAHAHSHGVVHRDVKPSNIFLTGDHAMIADFGIARAVTVAGGDRLTTSGMAIGTPAYMSPEQGGGVDHLDGRSDEYSLACVLYDMLCGEPPFTGATVQAVVARHMLETPPSLRVIRPTIGLDVERAINKALAKTPADRFDTVKQFAETLEAAASRPSMQAVSPGQPRLRVGSWRAAALGLVAILAGIAIYWGVVRGGRGVGIENQLDPHRVAVLYFDDRSDQQRYSHLAAAFSEDLIDALSRVDALEVIPRSGVRLFIAGADPLELIAQKLRVGTVVDGSVSGSSAILRVTVRLLDATRSIQLESVNISAATGELLALRDAVADTVSRFLRQRLGEEIRILGRRAGTDDDEAWELVQRAERERAFYEELRSAGDLSAARAALARAESLLLDAERLDGRWFEPAVLRGWIAIDRTKLLSGDTTLTDSVIDGRRFDETLTAIAHADRALRLKPEDPEALELRGIARYRLWNSSISIEDPSVLLAGAEQDLRAARETHPWPARTLSALSDLVRRKGDFAEARVLAEEAVRADEVLSDTRDVTFQLAQALIDQGQFGDAAEICDDGRARFPEDMRFSLCGLTALAASDSLEPEGAKAWALANEMVERSRPGALSLYRTNAHMMVAMVLARAGLKDSSRAVIEHARAAAPVDDPRAPSLAYNEAAAWLALGEREEALRALEVYLTAYPQRQTYIATDSWFRGLHDHPRFRKLVGSGQ